MTEIEPLKGIFYNQAKIRDISCVVCPPYDIISPAKQEYYHNLHPYNFIHVLLGKDTPGEDKYKRAGNYFRDWIKQGIFIQDDTPAIYFYAQHYVLKGQRMHRLGFIALLRLEDKDSQKKVFGHEHTRLEPKEDRLRLLREIKANLSPIFVIFPDYRRIIQRNFQQHIHSEKAFIDITDEEKVEHKLWRLQSQDTINKIKIQMQDASIFIADGHHRYEVACAFRDEMKSKLSKFTGKESFNYILAYFTNALSPGLTVLPIHRLVRLNNNKDIDDLKLGFKEFFDVEEVKDKNRFFFMMAKAGNTGHVLGMYKCKKYWLLRLKNIKILDRIIDDKPREFRLLDVAILNYLVFKRILQLDPEDKERINFIQDADELIQQTDDDFSSIGFFLNPVKVEQILRVAQSGYKMPAKSTYFYPKVLSGLIINKL
ncbi:MAG: DUF1015 domain-containing protein [Candidatus Omnitrophica bacterium]|nr:DUF1015 domain-containing protein [Candidatus Omnitrophota bacterium]